MMWKMYGEGVFESHIAIQVSNDIKIRISWLEYVALGLLCSGEHSDRDKWKQIEFRSGK